MELRRRRAARAAVPDDYVVATGEGSAAFREFVAAAFTAAGVTDWEKYVAEMDRQFVRPVEGTVMIGDPTQVSGHRLGWRPSVDLPKRLWLAWSPQISANRVSPSVRNAGSMRLEFSDRGWRCAQNVASRYESSIDIDQENNPHASLVRFVGLDKRVLELGATTGYMTEVLKQRGCTVTAVEFDLDAVDELREVADVTIVGDLNDHTVLQAAQGPFDVVLAGDVLEHLLDPLATLRQCVEQLGPDGRAVISIPNVAHSSLALALAHGGWRYTETGLLDRTHIFFFTYDRLLSVLAEAGLIVTSIERSVTGPFNTEQGLESESFDPELVAHVMGRPEAMTYRIRRFRRDRQRRSGAT